MKKWNAYICGKIKKNPKDQNKVFSYLYIAVYIKAVFHNTLSCLTQLLWFCNASSFFGYVDIYIKYSVLA